MGFLPPAHFANLPKVATESPKNKANQVVLAACLRSLDVAMRTAASKHDHLVRTYNLSV